MISLAIGLLFWKCNMTQLYEIVPTAPNDASIIVAPPFDYYVTGWGRFHYGGGVIYGVVDLTSPNTVTGRYDGVDLQSVYTLEIDMGSGGSEFYRGIQLGGDLSEFPLGFEWEDNSFVYNAQTVTADGWRKIDFTPFLQPVASTAWVKQITEEEYNAVRYQEGVSYRPLLRTFEPVRKRFTPVGPQRIDLNITFPEVRR